MREAMAGERPGVSAPSVPWAQRRGRAGVLRARYPYAAELLDVYLALLNPHERAHSLAREAPLDPAGLARWIAEHVLPGVVVATRTTAPGPLATVAESWLEFEDGAEAVAAWLAGREQPPTDAYFARAAAGPVLEALGPAAWPPGGSDAAGRCPRCGGPPQLSFLAEAGEELVTAPRRLLCARCTHAWVHPRMVCPGCGEESAARLPIFAPADGLPHLRADGCESCRSYLITVDLRKDPEAVPVVDELAALPLDAHARERGFHKIVPNLMGIG